MKVAFLFPGQGSQDVGMGKDIFEKYNVARMIYKTISEISNINVAELSFYGPVVKLKETENAQIAILTLSMAIFHIVTDAGLRPYIVAGHSLGEYSAIIAAGGLDIEDGIGLVRKRGQSMSNATIKSPGCMAAINGLNREEVEEFCKCVEPSAPVNIANYNSYKQFVISGTLNGVNAVVELARTKGAKVVHLPVSGAFHSSLMKEASVEFSEAVNGVKIKDLLYPVIGNVDASILTKPSDIVEEMKNHMVSPVKWYKSMEKILDMGIQKFVEIGPGNVLKGLLLRIYKNAEVFTTGSVRELDITIKRLLPG